jgi:DNA-binding XRE family transcriptional regulator
MNTPFPKPVAEDATTITFRRADWEAFLEDAADLASVARLDAQIQAIGLDEVIRQSYTGEEALQILDGMSPVTIWRKRAGLSQTALAAAAEISPGYLNEIEKGKKPGSVAALRKLAAVLNVPMENLAPPE